MNCALPVSSIEETAFLTAMYRAIETERPDAHFRDSYARLLAGTRGVRAIRKLRGRDAGAAGCVVRTFILDCLLQEAIEQSCVDLVLNLGAGLDTRPYRLPLSPSLKWIEVDTAEILKYKHAKLARYDPACSVEAVSLDVRDSRARRSFLDGVAAMANCVLVLTEGLLVYWSAQLVAALANDLSRQSQFRWWLSDLASPSLFLLCQRAFVDTRSRNAKATLKFAPAEGPWFFEPFGWRPVDCFSCVEEGRRLRRWLLPETHWATLTESQRKVIRSTSTVTKLENWQHFEPT